MLNLYNSELFTKSLLDIFDIKLAFTSLLYWYKKNKFLDSILSLLELYKNLLNLLFKSINRVALHAYAIEIIHPVINRKMKIFAPIPDDFNLGQAYPIPFNPITSLNFSIPIDTEVSLKIYNLQGREIISLMNGKTEAGYHSIIWIIHYSIYFSIRNYNK